MHSFSFHSSSSLLLLYFLCFDFIYNFLFLVLRLSKIISLPSSGRKESKVTGHSTLPDATCWIILGTLSLLLRAIVLFGSYYKVGTSLYLPKDVVNQDSIFLYGSCSRICNFEFNLRPCLFLQCELSSSELEKFSASLLPLAKTKLSLWTVVVNLKLFLPSLWKLRS